MESQPRRAAARRSAKRPRRNPVASIIGAVLLVAGLGVLGWYGYQYIYTSMVAEQAFESTTDDLEQQWSAPEAQAAEQPGEVQDDGTVTRIPGDAMGIMRVPAWGDDYAVPIYDGTDPQVLTRGLGWYENTAGPGQVGNFSVAGHSVTHGEPFKDLMGLPEGSSVVVETHDRIYTYVIDSSTVVHTSETWVLDPVPGEPQAEPTDQLLTLTTCEDVFRSPDRHIAFGHLADTQVK